MDNGKTMIKKVNHRKSIKEFWNEQSKRQRKIIYMLLGIIGIIIITILICILLIFGNPILCQTEYCQTAANQIRNFIDESQEPCDDFYRFACGMFTRNFSNERYDIQSVRHLMQEDIQLDIKKMLQEAPDNTDNPTFNLAKKFYKTCMNEKAIEQQGLRKIEKIFKEIGGWPILEGPDWDSEKFDFIKAVRILRNNGINTDFFFNISVEVDREKLDRYILVIHDKFYSPAEVSPNSKKDFLDYMIDVASQFDATNANLWKDQNDVLELMLLLAKISKESNKSNQTNLYNLHTLPELQHEYPTIPWFEYIQSIFGTHVTLHFDDIVSVSEPIYLKKLETVLRNTEKRILANFIGWQTVQNLINFLPSKILDKAYAFLSKVNGKFDKTPRWRMCVEATRKVLTPAINLAYVDRYFNESMRANITQLIRNVKTEFKRTLLMSDWLDEETKRRIVKTLVSSVEKIFSVTDIVDILEENTAYDDVEINENKLLEAVLHLDFISMNIHYSLIRKPVLDQWVKTQEFLSGLNIQYSPIENKLKFPLGLLRGIYYNDNRPDYMNYGLFGTVLAHQISHIFIEAKAYHVEEPTSNRQRLYSWWTPLSLSRYIDKLECVSNQYSRYEIRELNNIRTNVLITRDEDVADLAGLKVAYAAYSEQEWRYGRQPTLPDLKYTPKQLFWISSALQFCSKYSTRYIRDKYSSNRYHHSPNEIRVNGPLRNLEEFAYDFGCHKDSYMNPEKKCSVW
ncbi:neprilysin-2-like [Rhynchophorus ferrugineus]|uniref:neprilysin-2-like n=1 Tax=Rhynchophorus ferrugineus TaxID=354439 RepID=UPI003FCE853B